MKKISIDGGKTFYRDYEETLAFTPDDISLIDELLDVMDEDMVDDIVDETGAMFNGELVDIYLERAEEDIVIDICKEDER